MKGQAELGFAETEPAKPAAKPPRKKSAPKPAPEPTRRTGGRQSSREEGAAAREKGCSQESRPG